MDIYYRNVSSKRISDQKKLRRKQHDIQHDLSRKFWGGGGSGITGLTYYGTTSVFRQGVYAIPTFPVVASRSVILMCPDEKDGGYVILFASYTTDATRYDYGNITQYGRNSGANKNYAVAEGLTEIPPSRYSVFKSWMEDHTITDVPVYLLDQS